MRFLLLALVSLHAPVLCAQDPQPTGFDIPAPDTSDLKPTSLWATYYFIWHAQEGLEGTPLLDTSGNPLSGPISQKDWCLSAIEGTTRLTDATGVVRTFNFDGTGETAQVNCAKVLNIDPLEKAWIRATGRTRFRSAYGPYGDGTGKYVLVPYRTIAVDSSQLPFGSVMYIPDARGVKIELPDGRQETHDGYFFAADSGGAIKKNHIDVFAGTFRKNPFPSFVKSKKYCEDNPKKSCAFQAFAIDDKAIADRLRAAHLRQKSAADLSLPAPRPITLPSATTSPSAPKSNPGL